MLDGGHTVRRNQEKPPRGLALAVPGVGDLPDSAGEPFGWAGGAEHRRKLGVLHRTFPSHFSGCSSGYSQWAPENVGIEPLTRHRRTVGGVRRHPDLGCGPGEWSRAVGDLSARALTATSRQPIDAGAFVGARRAVGPVSSRKPWVWRRDDADTHRPDGRS